MKKQYFRALICTLLISIYVMTLFLVPKGYSIINEIDSEIGESPVIDGYIDLASSEWDKATSEDIFLVDFPITLMVLQNEENLYISVQFNLEVEYHSINEFIGLVISNSSSTDEEEFIDAKIIQFTNISSNEYIYSDYYIDNGDFLNDSIQDGNGAASLENGISTYEFSIPIKGSLTNEQDATLYFGNTYAFNITYGETSNYRTGIKKSSIILINIKPTKNSKTLSMELALLIIIIVIFSFLGILYSYYIIQVFRLKEKIKRIKR
ncbi:MAG: hypothetical protein ACFFDH_22375 [Promethearchaeota archaeon]